MNGDGSEISTASPSPQNGSPGAVPKNFDELRAKTRDPRGSKAGVKRGPYNKGARPAPAAAPALEASAPMFTPESMRPLVSLPFDLAFVKTGFTGFPLTEGEASTLSHTGAMVFNQWVTIDPRWVALITFSLSLSSISISKIAAYKQALLIREEEERKKNPEVKPA